MPRKLPPPGFMSASQAANRLGVTRAMIGIYVKQGKLNRYGPETRQQKFYKEAEVEALREVEENFFGKMQKESAALFALAHPSDMEGVEDLATRLFGKRSSLGADRRRSWLAKEPRGNYVMKRKTDNKVVASFSILPLDHHTLVDSLHRKIPGCHITADHILPFAPGIARECFIGAIGTDPDADSDVRSAYMAMLLRGIRQDLETLAQQGVTISKLYAASNSFEGTYLCLHLGMALWEPPTQKRLTFVLDVNTSGTFLLQRYKKTLAEWQKRPGL